MVVGTPATVFGDNTGSEYDFIFGTNVVFEGFSTTECTNFTVAYCGTVPAFTGALVKR